MNKNFYPSEQGAVMLVSIIILVLMTIIGVAAINTTTTELSISKKHELRTRQFYYSDGALNRVLQNTSDWLGANSSLLTDQNSTILTFKQDVDADGVDEANATVSGITMNSSDELPDMEHKSSPPVGSGYSSKNFQVRRYAIVANSTAANIVSELEGGCWKIFPK